MHATDIVAYDYDGDRYCSLECVKQAMLARGVLAPAARDMDASQALDQLANTLGIVDVQDERSYDSGDYPKVVFADQIGDDEHDDCAQCL